MNLNSLLNRFKNPSFWGVLIVLIAGQIGQYYGVSVDDMTSWPTVFHLIQEALSTPVVLLNIVIACAAAFHDPTTSGLGDSESVLSRSEPN